jgi:hypothetical protein
MQQPTRKKEPENISRNQNIDVKDLSERVIDSRIGCIGIAHDGNKAIETSIRNDSAKLLNLYYFFESIIEHHHHRLYWKANLRHEM